MERYWEWKRSSGFWKHECSLSPLCLGAGVHVPPKCCHVNGRKHVCNVYFLFHDAVTLLESIANPSKLRGEVSTKMHKDMRWASSVRLRARGWCHFEYHCQWCSARWRMQTLSLSYELLELLIQDVLFNSRYQKRCIGRCIDVQDCTRCCIMNIMKCNLLSLGLVKVAFGFFQTCMMVCRSIWTLHMINLLRTPTQMLPC